MLREITACAREDVGKVPDPREQALFETTAEVLLGLEKAHQDFGDCSRFGSRGKDGNKVKLKQRAAVEVRVEAGAADTTVKDGLTFPQELCGFYGLQI